MARNPGHDRESRWRRYLVPALVLLVMVEMHNITHSKFREFLLIAFASGLVASLVSTYIAWRMNMELDDISKVPTLKISPKLVKIISGEDYHMVPYARVEGEVKAVHQPIQSMYIEGISGVMQKVERREYTSKWDKQKKKWLDADKSIHKASKSVPFTLINEGASVKVKDLEEASGLQLTSFYDKFYPTNESLFQSISGWFHGAKTKGHQNIELILQEGQAVTCVGELRLRNNEVLLYPPSNERKYIMSTSYANYRRDVTKEIRASVTKLKAIRICSFILSIASVIANALLDVQLLFILCGFSLILITHLPFHIWLRHHQRVNTKLRKAFNRRVQDIEDHDSDDGVVGTSSASDTGEDAEDEDDQHKCVVCMSEPRDCVLVDCGHVCVCQDCAKELNPHQCPICRKRIVQVMPIYHA